MFVAAVLRLVVLAVVLLLVYNLLLNWSRNSRRRELADLWSEGEGRGLDRDAFIAEGMNAYESSGERKLLYGVFVLPLVVAISLTVLAS